MQTKYVIVVAAVVIVALLIGATTAMGSKPSLDVSKETERVRGQQKDLVTAITMSYDGPAVFFGVKEIEVYDGDGNYLAPDEFIMTQSSTLGPYTAVQAMNGLHSKWKEGTLTQTSTKAWWKATLKTPSSISSIKLYSHGVKQLPYSTLTLDTATTSKDFVPVVKHQQVFSF